jgi:hypothetical protein
MSEFGDYLPRCWLEKGALLMRPEPRILGLLTPRRRSSAPAFHLACALSMAGGASVAFESPAVACTTGLAVEPGIDIPDLAIRDEVADVPPGYWAKAMRSLRRLPKPPPEAPVQEPDLF